MNLSELKSNKSFLILWFLANFLAFPVGFALAVILSDTIVNLFHPEETNLIVGLCMGASVGFAQWLTLKKTLSLPTWWITATAIGIGIPFALIVILKEAGFTMPALFNIDGFFEGAVFFAAGAIVGVLQFNIIKTYFNNPYIWILASGIAWMISLEIQNLLLPGLVMGLITLIALIGVLDRKTDQV